ncbi:MAG: SCP2 sterol-binding domain-containing protein [Defluviitaleaceae bacterium]|nr:SCP2 sterol-binding domain-containing protein [Defluviitaleaceae bacterium]MCL2276179.1 SCP2 sterol-binding domain-containing protein [Defluviitaleaceae bacterium]
MKIAYISANLPHYDKGMNKLLAHTKSVFTELGVETSELNLGLIHPPYFDGMKNAHLDSNLAPVREAEGIIFFCAAPFFAPSAIMQTFLEYLALPEYSALLQGKCCALIVASDTGGERAALQSLSRMVQHMGGYDVVHIGLQAIHLAAFDTDENLRDIIDKDLEDFYRAVRQGRARIIPQDYAAGAIPAGVPVSANGSAPAPEKKTESKASKRLDAFTEQQEREIEELSRLFAEKYTEPDGEDNPMDNDPVPAFAPLTAAAPTRRKTARQLTQSLPHYFQPQLSAATQAVIQITITGDENFEGYLTIQSKECTYTDGIADTPDVTVIAEASLWLDVLNNKLTAQKAFMIGGLKVRGALALFTKFDTLFKLG